MIFDAELLRRFDTRGPRYTSYPTADRFATFPKESAAHHLGLRAQAEKDASEPLSLYVHLPFCEQICYFCACNKIITKDHGRSAKYLRYLEKELSLVRAFFGKENPKIIQLHLGGGSPTFLSSAEMSELMSMISARFDLLPDGEISIEVDPRRIAAPFVAHLAALGFNRMSLGVQDFDPEVQKAIHRIQPFLEVKTVLDAARAAGFASVSFDLIYGLPYQNQASFARTLDLVLELSPDRLSVYNYAHLPALFAPQRRISEESLPSPQMRLDILAEAINRLLAAGYVYIGMDHFAKPEDDLAQAQKKGLLHRNFQGYSTFANCDLLSFGISAISQVAGAYYQNHKTLEDYYAALDRACLPTFRGMSLSSDDLLRAAVIQEIMCQGKVSFAAIEQSFGIHFPSYFAPELAKLGTASFAPLLTLKRDRFEITETGHFFLRSIAMVFDRYLQLSTPVTRYSKVI